MFVVLGLGIGTDDTQILDPLIRPAIWSSVVSPEGLT
jgi:hypothetical protein